MVTKSDHFITQMKLRELREQRTRLLQIYGDLLERVKQEKTETGRLRVLYQGLREITFVHHPLHPNIANMEPLLDDMTTDQTMIETVSFWREHLEQELAHGQLRSEIVYIFGALLEEWAQHHTESSVSSPEQTEQQKLLLAALTQAVPARGDDELFDPFFSVLRLIDPNFPLTLAQIVETHMAQPVQSREVKTALGFIGADNDRTLAIRRQAQAFMRDPIILKEFGDALTIQLAHLEEWQWPRDGVPTHVVQTNQKWRLFLNDDLPTTCFLEVVGMRWQHIFQDFFRGMNQKASLQMRQEMLAEGATDYQVPPAFLHALSPDHLAKQEITEQLFQSFIRATHRNTYSMAASEFELYEEVDIWKKLAERNPFSFKEPRLVHYGSITRLRAQFKKQLRQIKRAAVGGYGVHRRQSSPNAMETALLLINAELILGRTAFPDQPLHVLKVDLQDYYPSLGHDLLLTILQQFGIPSIHLNFFRTFFRIPLQDEGQVIQVQRGIPNSRTLSDLLGELVLRLLDASLLRASRVQIVRVFDDICILASSDTEARSAWQAVQRFCQVNGLAINQEKCGSVCVNGERLQDLPAGHPGWLMLMLDQDGEWNVNAEAFTRYVQQAYEEIKQIPSLLLQIERYNTSLSYLVRALVLQLPLGERHRSSVNNALQSFHKAIFPEYEGATETLRRSIQERFLDQTSTLHLPEAWFYWPITAGGTGLYQARLLTSRYHEQYLQYTFPKPPETRVTDWQDQSLEWGQFYSGLFSSFEVDAPVTNQVMETLVNDFIQRGAELSDGKQQDLVAYWRWILYLYGPQILDQLGTFRFLIPELVPLQIIMKRYRRIEEADPE